MIQTGVADSCRRTKGVLSAVRPGNGLAPAGRARRIERCWTEPLVLGPPLFGLDPPPAQRVVLLNPKSTGSRVVPRHQPATLPPQMAPTAPVLAVAASSRLGRHPGG